MRRSGTRHGTRWRGFPFREAGQVLRSALATTSGLTRAGVIDSLGWRGEAVSVPLVVPFLKDPQPEIAAAAAAALGRLATPEAAAALTEVRDALAPTVRPVVLEAMLRAADRLAGKQPDLAVTWYSAPVRGWKRRRRSGPPRGVD